VLRAEAGVELRPVDVPPVPGRGVLATSVGLLAPLGGLPRRLRLALRFAHAAVLVAAGYEGVQFVLDGLARRYVPADGPARAARGIHASAPPFLRHHLHTSQSQPTPCVIKASTSGRICAPFGAYPYNSAATEAASALSWLAGQPLCRQWVHLLLQPSRRLGEELPDGRGHSRKAPGSNATVATLRSISGIRGGIRRTGGIRRCGVATRIRLTCSVFSYGGISGIIRGALSQGYDRAPLLFGPGSPDAGATSSGTTSCIRLHSHRADFGHALSLAKDTPMSSATASSFLWSSVEVPS